MTSTSDFEWTKPLAVKPDLLRRTQELVAAYGALASRQAVVDEGFSPDAVRSAEDADRLFKETKQFGYSSVARDMRRATEVTWSVTLSNGIRRSGLSLDEVLALPNSKEASIEEVQVANGGYGFTLQVTFSKSRYRRASSIRLNGPYDVVGHYKSEISNLLSAFTRNWQVVTRGWFGATLTLLFAIAFVLTVTIVAASFLAGSSLSPDNQSSILLLAFWVSGSIVPFIMSPISKGWQGIFPFVEFHIGGGINAAEVRRNWRKATWSVPILLLGMPIITNLISDRLG